MGISVKKAVREGLIGLMQRRGLDREASRAPGVQIGALQLPPSGGIATGVRRKERETLYGCPVVLSGHTAISQSSYAAFHPFLSA